MDAREYFQNVVVPNYNEFVERPSEFRLLENALLSMNAVPEYLALDRLGYPPLRRDVLDGVAQKIRHQFCYLLDLKFCAEVCKHVRKIKDHSGGFTLQASSTSVDPNDQTTWNVNGKHLVKVAHFAFAALKEIPELK
ncbi:MAG: hypothetical protein WCD69_14915 [Xanthobacteraceae bacterium]|jgi:hypothetical protein